MSDDSLLRQAMKQENDVSHRFPVTQTGETIESLIRKHYQVIYRYAYRLTGKSCDAEDLTQQCFLTAHRKLHQLRDVNAAKSWLCQILRTAFFQLCRKKRPDLAIDSVVEIESAVQTPQHSTPHFDRELLQQRLNDLPENYRIALLMYFFEDKSYEEIANELGIPIGTVMSRLSRAKAKLRNRLERVGVTP